MPTLVVPRVVGKGEMEPATWSNTSTRRRRGIIHWETCKRRVTKVKMFTSFFLPCSQKATAKGERGKGGGENTLPRNLARRLGPVQGAKYDLCWF